MTRSRTRWKLPALICVLLCFWCTRNSSAQTAPPKPPTLAEAFKVAAPPDPGEVLLTVNGDRVNPPKGAAPLGVLPDFRTIATDYGLVAQSFGDVTAIAPSTMVILNTAPSQPDIYANLPTYDAYTLLVASLTDTEYGELTSEQGLPLSELNSDWQQKLLASLLSKDGKLLIRPRYRYDQEWSDANLIDATDRIQSSRLRMGQTVQIQLPIKGGNGYYGGQWAPAPNGDRDWQVSDRQDYGGAADVAFGSRVRAEVPNVLKLSQLDYSAPALEAEISLTGVKSVGNLFARIEAACHIELYVDPRLDQSMQIIGATSAKASDLLQAVALCQMATYRQVGPAFVLTDDAAGVGTRRQLWHEFDQLAETLRRKPLQEAAELSYKLRSPKDIPWFADPMQYTPQQAKRPGNDAVSFDEKLLPSLSTTFDKLTPDQQAAAQRQEDEWNNEVKAGRLGGQPITTDGNISVSPSLKIMLLVPGVVDPVDMNINGGELDDSLVFQGTTDESDKQTANRNTELAKQYAPATTEAVGQSLGALTAGAKSRAAISHARTAAGVDADIAAAKTLGLNQLWLDIFSEGQAHIPGSALAALPHPLKPGENDILAEALARGKAAGIAVYPMIDLFYWGQSPPADVADLNLFGETSAQEEARWNQRKAMLPPGQMMSEMFTSGSIIPDFPGVAVAPTYPQVRSDLIGLARLVAQRPGAAGIVLRDSDPPGYDLAQGNLLESADLQLGFVVPARLAFLRKHHADPIDLYPTGTYTSVANTDLPNFSDDNGWTSGLSSNLWGDWAKFRRDANLQLMEDIYKAAMPTGSASPAQSGFTVIVKQRRHGQLETDYYGRIKFEQGWYGSWDSVSTEPPTFRSYEEVAPGGIQQQPAAESDQAAQQSHFSYEPVTHDAIETMASFWKPTASKLKTSLPYPGIVLDLSDDPFGDNGNGSDPLTNLAGDLSPRPLPRGKGSN